MLAFFFQLLFNSSLYLSINGGAELFFIRDFVTFRHQSDNKRDVVKKSSL